MAYTAWSVVYGEQPTAAKWNQLGTNDAGFKDGTNIDNLAIIARHMGNDSILAPAIGQLPAARVYRGTNQSLGNNTDSPIAFTAEEYDTDGMWASASPTRVTAVTAGYYAVAGVGRFNNNGVGERHLAIRRNGAITYRQGVSSVSGSFWQWLNVSEVIKLAAGDYLEMSMMQSSGGALDALGGIASLSLSVHYIGGV